MVVAILILIPFLFLVYMPIQLVACKPPWYLRCLYLIISNKCQQPSSMCKPSRFFNGLSHLLTILRLFHTYQLVHLHHQLICGKGCPFSIHLPLHYYYCDCLGLPFVCLHLLKHALYILWMDFHPCLYIYRVIIWNESKGSSRQYR